MQNTTTAEPTLPHAAVSRASPDLLNFKEGQIKDMEKELGIASQASIFRCEEDHLCREKVVFCPVCKVGYIRDGHKRLRGSERPAERLAEMYN